MINIAGNVKPIVGHVFKMPRACHTNIDNVLNTAMSFSKVKLAKARIINKIRYTNIKTEPLVTIIFVIIKNKDGTTTTLCALCNSSTAENLIYKKFTKENLQLPSVKRKAFFQ